MSNQKPYLIDDQAITNEDLGPTLAGLAYQNLHHRVFHLAKKLLTLSNHNGNDILRPFLAWSYENQLTMDWTMHIHLLRWLNQQEIWVREIKKNAGKEQEIVKELLMASVIHWSLNGLDHVRAKGILVASPDLRGLGVGLKKNETPEMDHKIVIVRSRGVLKNCYALTFNNDWRELEWQIIG